MRIAIIRLKDLLQNYQLIPRVDHTSVENLRKNSLFRHNALSHFLKDRTSAVAFFSNLCQLQDYIIALEFRTDRKCGKVDSLNHQVLSECPVFYLCTSGAKIFNLVKREQTYLTVPFAGMGITKVVGPEARGFMVGVPVAVALGAGFVPARKPGKLPRKTVSESYELEYGTDSIEIHADAITSKDTVLILDDLVATGGTVEATGKLVRDMGAKLVGYGCILELAFLNPRKKLTPSNEDVELFSLVTVD